MFITTLLTVMNLSLQLPSALWNFIVSFSSCLSCSHCSRNIIFCLNRQLFSVKMLLKPSVNDLLCMIMCCETAVCIYIQTGAKESPQKIYYSYFNTY